MTHVSTRVNLPSIEPRERASRPRTAGSMHEQSRRLSRRSGRTH